MKKLSILIVEDEKLISESLVEMIECLEYEVMGVAENAIEALRLLDESDPDLVLLDIQLKGDTNGIELARCIKEDYNVPFIFTTAFADPVTIEKARREGPYGYLVKPYGIKDINASVEMAIHKFKEISELRLKNEKLGELSDHTVYLKVNSRLVKVNYSDILWIECKGDYAVFKTENDSFIIHSTMKNIEKKLEPMRFVKVHRSYIVNLDKIVDIEDTNLLINEKIIPISRGNKEALMKKINLI